MSKLSMFAVSVVLAIGCGGKKDPVDKAIAGLEDWKAKMCACKDKACADKVHEDYKKWENDVMEPSLKGVDEKSVAKDKMAKFEKLEDERKDCRRKFSEGAGGDMGGGGGTPPTAEGSAAAPAGSAAAPAGSAAAPAEGSAK